MKSYSYLALGDSYTIGEQVLPGENFPNQTVKLLNATAEGAESCRRGFTQTPSAVANPDGGYTFNNPEIIAATGWTTDELNTAITAAKISKTYDIVSLLIGVNNQYRGRPLENFAIEFQQLLHLAIGLANNQPAHVFVLSIPDWGVTPFAKDKDKKKIAQDIDGYNDVCKTTAAKFNTNYIDITASQRDDGNKHEFLAADQLHPSGNEYAKWAHNLAARIPLFFNTQ